MQAVELSAMYHDLVKDRLYTDPANSPRRRSTQTTLYRLVIQLCQLLSPILAYTTDEAWEFVPGVSVTSPHISEWTAVRFEPSDEEQATWTSLFELRDQALTPLEKARQDKLIGKSLEAKVIVTGNATAIARAFIFRSPSVWAILLSKVKTSKKRMATASYLTT